MVRQGELWDGYLAEFTQSSDFYKEVGKVR